MSPPVSPDLPLADIHLPPPAGWWPAAFGWWVLAAVLFAAMLFAARRALRRRRRRRWIRALLTAFDAKMARPLAPAQQLAELSALLRRVAALVAPQASTLADTEWLLWLDAGDPARPFSQGPGRLLRHVPYQPEQVARAIDPDEFAALLRLSRARIAQWVECVDV